MDKTKLEIKKVQAIEAIGERMTALEVKIDTLIEATKRIEAIFTETQATLKPEKRGKSL